MTAVGALLQLELLEFDSVMFISSTMIAIGQSYIASVFHNNDDVSGSEYK